MRVFITNVSAGLIETGGPLVPYVLRFLLPLFPLVSFLYFGVAFQVVVLLNAGDTTAEVTAHWKDIGLVAGVAVKVTDLWTGKSSTVPSKGADIISVR